MQEVLIAVSGIAVDFDIARRVALALAAGDNPDEVSLVAWFDRGKGKHSPSCMKCEFKDAPGWEVYGRNHGGRLKVVVNEGEYVFIYS